MKKLLAVILVCVMAISLAACGSSSKTFELNIPSEFIGEMTQEELDESAKEAGCQVTLNDDGSATYILTERQHKKLIKQFADNINASLEEMIGSDTYPNITDISTNSDFTEFKIKTKSEKLDFNESFSFLVFYLYGGMYSAFSGEEAENIHVEFINADSGEIISSSDSSELGNLNESEALEATLSPTETPKPDDGIIDCTFDSLHVRYLRHEILYNILDEECLVVYYEFTNNSSDNAAFSWKISDKVFQNGVELNSSYLSNLSESENSMLEIQPGTTTTVASVFKLSDHSNVTLEVDKLISFDSSNTDTMILTLE